MRKLVGTALITAVLAGCAPPAKQVQDTTERAGSWAATVKVVTEQWAQSRVSMRFVRTTLTTAAANLSRDADSVRSLDPSAATRIERLKNALDSVMDAVALNEPDQARDAAARLPAIVEPEPSRP